jgi:hypothetical protein
MPLKATAHNYLEAQVLERRGQGYDMTIEQLNASIVWPAWQRQGDRSCGGCGIQITMPRRVVVRPDPNYRVFGICASCCLGSDAEIVLRVKRRLARGGR